MDPEKDDIVKEEDAEDGEEDSDDDIDIVLDSTGADNKPASLVNIKPPQAAASKPAREEGEAATAAAPATKAGIDINAVGQYEGKDILDVDLESFDDKPWRKPGADITDFFNYGFNENTWKAYNMKQKQIREEMQMQKRIHVYEFMDHQDPQQFGMPMDMVDAAGKYQRAVRGHFAPLPVPPGIRDLNNYGKRPREQDAVIQVAGEPDSQMDGGEEQGFQPPPDDFGGGHGGMYRGPGPEYGGHMMPPPGFIPPDMGGYDMYRRGGAYPPPMPMRGRGMMRQPPPQMSRPFFPPPAMGNPPKPSDSREYRDRRDEFGRDSRDGDRDEYYDEERWSRGDRKKR